MKKKSKPKIAFDALVIGGGFYGCAIALFLKKKFSRVAIVESNSNILAGASSLNQARIHNGYHYPRSLLTAIRSHSNYQRFISDYSDCVKDKFRSFYAISSFNSKTTSRQFQKFCSIVNLPLFSVSKRIKNLFNKQVLQDVFEVEESVFDAKRLASILRKQLNEAKITLLTSTTVERVADGKGNSLEVHLKNSGRLKAKFVFNCTYSKVNSLLHKSNLPGLPLKHELTEIAVVDVPAELDGIGITVMDGSFFSLQPFPFAKKHSFTHVRYTPHDSWVDADKPKTPQTPSGSKFRYMFNDAQRFLPMIKHITYDSSLYEVKTLLLNNEVDDGRPILLRKDYGLKNFYIILGGKIDNIYDVLDSLNGMIN